MRKILIITFILALILLCSVIYRESQQRKESENQQLEKVGIDLSAPAYVIKTV